MMAYDSQFVLCVLHDGSPVREINGKVSIPFSSEYKIRLKNKHPNLRAKARVWVDGRKASGLGDFILGPGETLDLERFLDESMTSGRRFQFVPLSDSRVNDPTDSDNGIIKVEFYREVQNYFDNWKITINPGDPTRPPKPWTPRDPWNPTWSSETITTGGRRVSSHCYNSFSSSLSAQNIVAPIAQSQLGATVEGSHSGQSFVYGSDFSTEVFPTTLTLRLRGITASNPHPTVCPGVKPPKHNRERFCGSCGKRRSRMSDRFCGRCGASYQTVR
jgi:hypothetical protein